MEGYIGMLLMIATSLFSAIFSQKTTNPKKMSSIGYKTPRSLKNPRNWEIANTFLIRYMWISFFTFSLTCILIIIFIEPTEKMAILFSFILVVQSLASIPITEFVLILFEKMEKRKDSGGDPEKDEQAKSKKNIS